MIRIKKNSGIFANMSLLQSPRELSVFTDQRQILMREMCEAIKNQQELLINEQELAKLRLQQSGHKEN